MKIQTTVSSWPARACRLSLGLACGTLSACSGVYPLGDVSKDDLIDDSDPSGSAGDGDAHLGPVLAAPDVTFTIGDLSGYYSLVPVGDLDGDGYGDVTISSTLLDPPLRSVVRVRYGGPRPRTPEEGSAFERGGATLVVDRFDSLELVAAGDVDADGFDDFIARTSECDETQPYEGAYLVYGGERLEGTLSLASVAAHFRPPRRVGNPTEGLACLSSARAAGPGDLDGDGIDDFVLSSHPQRLQDDSIVFGTGEGVYVFYGRNERFSGELEFSDADASFHVQDLVNAYPAGDLNGDARADLLIGPSPNLRLLSAGRPSFALAGRAQRWSGSLELAPNATPIAGGFLDGLAPNDLDGDGFSELFVRDVDDERVLHLFYGAPDVFERGFDRERADASFSRNNRPALAVGDRDGDGDDELLAVVHPARFTPDISLSRRSVADFAFVSGSRTRFSGEVSFPRPEVVAQTPNGRFPEDSERVLERVIPAGDLDGDGAADLFTTSHRLSYSDQGSEISEEQLHLHYAAPENLAAEPR